MGKAYNPPTRRAKGAKFYELQAYKDKPDPNGPREYHEPGRRGQDPGSHARHAARYLWALGAAAEARVAPGLRWLDCACGTGYGTQMLWAEAPPGIRPAHVTGVDRSLKATTIAKSKHRAPGEPLSYHHLDIRGARQWLPMLGPFDVVVCVETLEHLHQVRQADWLYNVGANLQPHGALLLCCPVSELGGRNPDNRWHLHEPTPDALRAQLLALFGRVHMDLQEYTSTSGPAVQARAVCTLPKLQEPPA